MARAIGHGAREGALHVAAQLRFEELVGQGRRVDGDEIAPAPRVAMERLGDPFLAGAGLAVQMDGGVGDGDPGHRSQQLEHGRARRHQARKADSLAGRGALVGGMGRQQAGQLARQRQLALRKAGLPVAAVEVQRAPGVDRSHQREVEDGR